MAQTHAIGQTTENDPVPTTTTDPAPPGVQALEALIAKGGVPEPKEVVFVLDAHRGDRDAIFAYLHQTLGAGYVRSVVEAADKLRLSIGNKELVAGDPSDPTDGYFLASVEEKGARWRTGDGDFTGKIDQDGLDSNYQIDEDDRLHANVSAKDKTGTLSWLRDDEMRAQLYGGFESGSDWHAGARGNWQAGGGTFDADLRHSVTESGASQKLTTGYVTDDERTRAGLTVQHQDGTVTGALTGSHQLESGGTLNGALTRNADNTALTGGYASERTNVNGGVTVTDAGVVTGNLAGSHQLESGGTLNGALTRNADNTALTGGYASERTNVNGGLTVTDAGLVTGNLTGSHKLSDNSLINGSVSRDADSWDLAGGYKDDKTTVNGALSLPDSGRWTGSLSATHQLDPQTQLRGSFARTEDRNSFELGGSRKTDNLDLSGSLKYEDIVGQGSQTSLKLSERYNSGNLIHGLDLDAGVGVRDYLTMTGSAEGRLADNWYAGGWTSLKLEGGKEASAQLGGSLTFTPHERAALTFAGVVDQSGTLETRLQLDVFKDKINSIGALSKHKKDALFSLFVSYSTQAGPRQLDNRFGAPDQWQSGQGQIMGGIRINF